MPDPWWVNHYRLHVFPETPALEYFHLSDYYSSPPVLAYFQDINIQNGKASSSSALVGKTELGKGKLLTIN